MKRTVFWCFVGLAALFGIAATAVTLAVKRPHLIRPLVQWALAPRGGTATLSGLNVSLSPPALTLSGLAIARPPRESDRLQLDHLRVEPALGRIFSGGPWLRRIEARGLVFERSRPRVAAGPPDLTPLSRLFDIENLSLSDVRLRLALTTGNLAADVPRLEMSPGDGGIRRLSGNGELSFRGTGAARAEGRFAARGTMMPGPAIDFDMELAPARLDLPWLSGGILGRASMRLTRKRLEGADLTFTLAEARLGPRGRTSPGPIRLDAAGSTTLDLKDFNLEVRELIVGDLLRARGRLGGPTLDRLSGTVDGEVPRVERVKALLASLLPRQVDGMDFTGALPFRIHLTARGADRVLGLELQPRQVDFSWPDAKLACRFGGTVEVTGPVQEMRRGPVVLGWKLSAEAGGVRYDGRTLPLGKLEVQGNARAAGAALRVDAVEIRSETVGRLSGNLAVRGGHPSGAVSGSGLSAGSLVSLAAALTGRDWNGWSPAGAIDVALRVDPAESGPLVAARIALGRIGFSSPTGDAMGQNLEGSLDLVARLSPRLLLTADLAMRRGDALWKTVYVDFAKEPLDLRARVVRAGDGEYKDILLDGGLAGFGRLGLEGEARREGGHWRHRGKLVLSDARLGPVFRTFLRDPLAASHPDLAALEMDGSAQMDLSFSGSQETAEMNGRLLVRAGAMRRAGEPPVLSGLDIDLPIAYSLGVPDPGGARPSEAAGWGRLSAKEIRLSGQQLGPLEMPVALVANRLYLGGTIDAPLFGTRLHLQKIQVDEPLSPAFRIGLAARLEDLDLARLGVKKPALEGRLGGVLDPVRIGRDRLTAAGELTGALFGGRVDIRNLTVDRPFGPGREIGADVDVDRLDLERLSEALGVGRITGRLSGALEGLRVAYGQPVAFHLKMESVPAKGVPQQVSLKAVNSISLVSTGSALSGAGLSLMTTFFREFGYEKIGFECGLKNDVFTVRGLIHKDGVEYLVKRRLFTGINVINRNPDNRIGFSDMLERARRATGERSQ